MNAKALVLAVLFLPARMAYADSQPVKEEHVRQETKNPMPRNDINGLPNFAKVSDALYRGAQPSKSGFAELKKMGIKTIINLRAGHSDEKYIKDMDFKYFSVPIRTWNVTDKHSIEFLKITTNPANQPVFVHCQHGADRTGSMVAVYRIYVQKWKSEEAIKELPVFGFHKIWFNLRRYLKKLDVKKLETGIKQNNKTSPAGQ